MEPSVDFREYYENRNSVKTVTSDNPHSRDLVAIVGNALALRPEDSVLDVGCSDGYLLQRLMEAAPYHSGVGVDISDHSVKLARSLVQLPNVSFIQGYADNLPFQDESFDKIICNEVIEHIPDDEGTLRELWRVCRRDGRVYVTAPNSLKAILPLFVTYCKKVDKVEGHLRRYSADEFRSLASSTGFKVIQIEYNGFIASFLWYSLIIYNAPLKKWLMKLAVRRNSAVDQADAALPTERPTFSLIARLGFFVMRMVSALDSPFRKSSKNMGFYAVLVKE